MVLQPPFLSAHRRENQSLHESYWYSVHTLDNKGETVDRPIECTSFAVLAVYTYDPLVTELSAKIGSLVILVVLYQYHVAVVVDYVATEVDKQKGLL
jgi:hypothetical protein